MRGSRVYSTGMFFGPAFRVSRREASRSFARIGNRMFLDSP